MSVALIATALIAIGFFVSPQGISPELAAANRAIGVITIWFAAYFVRQTLITRANVLRLSWLSTGQGRIAQSALGEMKPEEVAHGLLSSLATYVGAQTAVLYRRDAGVLVRTAAYALAGTPAAPGTLRLGEGTAGTVAQSGKPVVLADLPPGYLQITSATGAAAPQTVIVAPVTAEGVTSGIVELGFIRTPDNIDDVMALLERVANDLGVSVQAAQYRQRALELLEETQRQSEELQTQQEELRVANEELTEQSSALRESQVRLENQQAELEETNAQLEAQATDLERQKVELLDVQGALRASAARLERASRYKSEFLANMSHELRTPLNSSLILSKVLADNASGNLTEEQVNHAKIINTSNNDLLALINDILDLSKIEAGQVKIEPESVSLDAALDPIRKAFDPIAAEKGIEFRVDAGSNSPETLTTDVRRLQQILRNLLSNALKFTTKGSVELRVRPAQRGCIAFEVEDTGIGIPEDQLSLIFEAFHQADGTTSRKYGGTGLGLSISRELARLLGGSIEVRSAVGAGSVFTLTIAGVLDTSAAREPARVGAAPAPEPTAAAAAHQSGPKRPRSSISRTIAGSGCASASS